MTSYIMEHFRASYIPKASTVHLTLSGEVIKIDPWMLANISSLFRSIPTPSDDIFEVNQQGLLRNSRDIIMFVTMCGGSDILLNEESCTNSDCSLIIEYDEDNGDAVQAAESLLLASRLCDFLGIEAMSALHRYEHHLEQTHFNELLHNAMMFHQAALVTNNKIAIENIEKHILKRWIALRTEKTELGVEHIQMAVYDLYYRVCQKPIKAKKIKSFLLGRLGWERQSKHFGFNITIL